MVHDVDAAIAWYTKHLCFTVLSNAAPAFADVTLGSLRLLLSGPTSSAGRCGLGLSLRARCRMTDSQSWHGHLLRMAASAISRKSWPTTSGFASMKLLITCTICSGVAVFG